jgi:tetraacyldisaccharide 4'-kinase
MKNRSITDLLKFLLFPFAALYGLVVFFRNVCYDLNIFKSKSFDIPVIAVGNLSVGGTGKSPQVEYLIKLLKKDYKIAVLSRGYKRQSEGFLLANKNTVMAELGDEPFQFYTNHPDVLVAVDSERTSGINRLLELHPDIDVVLLDDAYQHRKVKASFYTLLTSYGNIYSDDFLLPIGTLRESRKGANRANAIVITKCPKNLEEVEQNKITRKISPSKHQKIYFTCIEYAKTIVSENDELLVLNLHKYEVVLVTGIANPNPLLNHLEQLGVNYSHLNFPDHYNFKNSDLENIQTTFSKIGSKEKIILTTEKDYMRLQGKLSSLYYIGIQTKFLNNSGLEFDAQVKKFKK